MAPTTVEARLRAAGTQVVPAGADAHPGLHRVAQGLALAVAALAGTGAPLQFPVTTTTALVAVLLPVWLPRLPRWRGAAVISALALVAVAWGLVLSSTTTHTVDGRLVESTVFQVLTAIGGMGLLLWVRTLVPVELLALAYGAGMLLTGLQDASGSPNAWKFELGLATTTIVLAAAQATRRWWVSVVALLLLGAVGAVNDTRSALGFAVATAAVVAWQGVTADRARAAGAAVQLRIAVLVVGLGYGLYAGATSLLVSGALGSGLAERTQAQVSNGGGSLLLGGRPELTASVALFQHQPLGFGLGVVPDRADVVLAKDAMARVGINAQNGYVDNYMFGGHIELHSVLADAWAGMGWGGIALVAGLVVLLVNALLTRLSLRAASPLAVFWTLYALWWTGFGPLYSNLPDIAFAVVLTALPAAGLSAARRRRSGWAAPAAPLPARAAQAPAGDPAAPSAATR